MLGRRTSTALSCSARSLYDNFHAVSSIGMVLTDVQRLLPFPVARLAAQPSG